MSRHLIDVAAGDLELIAEALETVAVQRRVAAERASAEVSRAQAAGEDVRTRSVRIVGVLGEAGRLTDAAAAVRAATELVAEPPAEPAAEQGYMPKTDAYLRSIMAADQDAASAPEQPQEAPAAPRRPRGARKPAQAALEALGAPAGASEALAEVLEAVETGVGSEEDEGVIV